jgi:4a-hydroxytetrahydrobiopterin dehydratase
MAEVLDDATVDERISGGDWTRDGSTIVRDLEFENFAAAMGYVNRVADAAEAANHHPDITVHGWNKVHLVLSTHSAGGVTGADLTLAAALDALV